MININSSQNGQFASIVVAVPACDIALSADSL
jgi:hypothetical protein